MNKPLLHKKSHSLKAKLFLFMLVLALILFSTFIVISILFGKSLDYRKELYNSLYFQSEIFENDIIKHYEAIEGNGSRLAEETETKIDSICDRYGFTIKDLNNDNDKITIVQTELFDVLCQRVKQTHCSGAFIMLDATVNTSIPNHEHSKTGIYLQRSGYQNGNAELILYRGIANLAKAKGIMPHRKWKLEFDSDAFPSYVALSTFKQGERYSFITDTFIIPGMDEYAQLVCFPIYSLNNERIGFCGYEISQSFFKTFHIQPSKEEQLICVLAHKTEDDIIASNSFSCGTVDGYYFNPTSTLVMTPKKNLNIYTGDNEKYVGMSRDIHLPNIEMPLAISVLIPKDIYDYHSSRHIAQIVVISLLLIFFAVSFSLVFSRRFLSPLLKAIGELKQTENMSEKKTNIPEINDLIEYLAEEEKKDEEHLHELEETHKELLNKLNDLQDNKEDLEEQLKNVQKQLNDLAAIQKKTIDEDDSEFFLSGITTLTPREKQVFDLYVQGYSAKQIMEKLDLTQNGLKYNNGNIYSKLGVESRKQLLFYISALSKK